MKIKGSMILKTVSEVDLKASYIMLRKAETEILLWSFEK